jgi:Protein of unknown function (DUF2726)
MGSFAGVVVGISVLVTVAAIVAHAGWRPHYICPPNGFLFTQRKFLFSAAERSFYEILRRISPDHTVFAKVPLCDLISVSKGSGRSHHRIQRKRVDFLICDAALKPVVAIELDGSSQSQADCQGRDQFVDAALAAAAIPIVRMPVERSYRLDEVRRSISPHLHGLGPLC